MSKIAIVILNWNGLNHLKQFLPGVVEHSHTPEHEVEVIVADNGSSDGSMEWVSREQHSVTTIDLPQNFGFAQGYNMALVQVSADYYVLLNSDVEVKQGWLTPLVAFMEQNADVAACMPKLVSQANPNYFEYAGAAGGFIDTLGYPFCRGRIVDCTEADTGQYNRPTPVFWATGACLMVRSDIYWAAGGLDPSFFAHMEEIDLCWRIKRMGHRLWCIPSSEVKHVGGGALPTNSPRKVLLNHRNNLLMLIKNVPPLKLAWLLPLRVGLDIAAALAYLATGKASFAASVFKAHWQAVTMLPNTLRNRSAFSAKYGFKVDGGIYPRSILLQYFLLKRKHFSQLPGVKGLLNSIGCDTL